MGHLACSEKFTIHHLQPIPALRIGHLQLPLTFRWLSTLPEEPDWKHSLGQQALSLHLLRLTCPLFYPLLNHPLSIKFVTHWAYIVLYTGVILNTDYNVLKMSVALFLWQESALTRDIGPINQVKRTSAYWIKAIKHNTFDNLILQKVWKFCLIV